MFLQMIVGISIPKIQASFGPCDHGIIDAVIPYSLIAAIRIDEHHVRGIAG